MPESTSEDVVSGFIGLTVVFARRNDTIPAMLTATPAMKNRRGDYGAHQVGQFKRRSGPGYPPHTGSDKHRSRQAVES